MNKTLVIYNNPWIFAQTLSILEELWVKEYDILINEKYQNTKEQVIQSRNWIKEYINKGTIDLDNINNYDIVIRPTPTDNDWLELLYDQIPNAKYIYIEEWVWFYTTDLNILQWDSYFKNWKVYLTYPEIVKWAKKLNNKRVTDIAKQRYEKELENLPLEIKTIIYTEPIVFDEHDKSYINKINKLIKEFPKPLLLKRHFRDDTKYQYWEGVFECFNQIPWQLFFELYHQAKLVFTWDTTLELYIHDKSRIIKI